MPRELLILLAQGAVILLSFGLGLRAPVSDAGYIIRRPGLLARSLLAVQVLVPVIAYGIILFITLPKVGKVGLLMLAASPCAPFIPMKVVDSERSFFVYGLQLIITVLTVVMTPLTLIVLGWTFNVDPVIGLWGIVKIMLLAQLIPLLLGMVLHKFATGFAQRIAPWVSRVALLALLALAILIVVKSFPLLIGLGIPTVAAIVLMVVASLAVGHFLGGPEPGNQLAVAVASSTRHPGLAIYLATQNFPEMKVAPMVIAYLILSSIISFPYLHWRKNRIHQTA